MGKVFSGSFGNTAGWTLVNDYTIHEERRLKDRPFMLTRVPNRLHVVMRNVRAIESIEWDGEPWGGKLTVDEEGNLVSDTSEEERKEGYVRKRIINGTGKFDDTKTIFSIEEGAVAQFGSLDNIRIAPLPRGMVGGKHKATTSDGIRFSGWSSRDVPKGGLMEGEPGTLWLNDGKGGPEEKPQTLDAELYIDEEQFEQIFQVIRDGTTNIEAVHLGIVAELFEAEVDAALTDPWQSHDYGMLKKKDWVQTNARLETIRVSFGGKLPAAPIEPVEVDVFGEDEDETERPAVANPLAYAAETNAQLKRLNARGGWLLGAVILLVIVTLLK